jgi:phosphoribosylformylglycinamidine synthase
MATLLRKSQVLVLPGGMSCGNEPDGSAKFPSAFFRNQRLTEELNNFIEIEQGLVLGIGDGFQTLIKLGLLPFGKITDTVPDSPALTMNSIGRYQSKIVRTKILTNNSPWLSGFEVGDTHVVPISCMEGRFSANDDLIEQIFADNLVAAQYVDLLGNPSMDIEFNPCGSSMAIEALVSKDGRILGKMGHFERGGRNLYKNIPGYKPHNIFENAVKYYTL